jgi:hypothetical protein
MICNPADWHFSIVDNRTQNISDAWFVEVCPKGPDVEDFVLRAHWKVVDPSRGGTH